MINYLRFFFKCLNRQKMATNCEYFKCKYALYRMESMWNFNGNTLPHDSTRVAVYDDVFVNVIGIGKHTFGGFEAM